MYDKFVLYGQERHSGAYPPRAVDFSRKMRYNIVTGQAAIGTEPVDFSEKRSGELEPHIREAYEYAKKAVITEDKP